MLTLTAGEEFGMLAKKDIPLEYREWNKRWGAPYGFHVDNSQVSLQRFSAKDPERYGPFGFQPTSHTRTLEYPWAYFSADPQPGMRVLDVGGWLSGLQVVLAKQGCEVVNVDPSEDEKWSIGVEKGNDTHAEIHRWFTSMFDVDVTLVTERLQDSDFEANSFDRIFAISVLEHVDQDEAELMVDTMCQLLAPGGLIVLSIDLFLDVKPFGMLDKNVWGRNTDVHALLSRNNLTLECGDPAELCGFPEFDPQRIADRIDEFFIGWNYPVLSQFVTLRKPLG